MQTLLMDRGALVRSLLVAFFFFCQPFACMLCQAFSERTLGGRLETSR